MKKFKYELLCDKEICEGYVKASSYENALEMVRLKFHNKEIHCLRVFKRDNALKNLFSYFFGDLSTFLFKLLPIAMGIILVFLLINQCSFQ